MTMHAGDLKTTDTHEEALGQSEALLDDDQTRYYLGTKHRHPAKAVYILQRHMSCQDTDKRKA